MVWENFKHTVAPMPEIKKTMFRLSPEAYDGQHHTIVYDAEAVATAAKDWATSAMPGDTIGVEAVEMTDEDFNNLPEV